MGSRRLRELLPLLGMKGDSSRKLTRRLKKVTARLGVVRELDVLMRLLQQFGGDERYSSAALKQVTAAVDADRTDARAHLASKLPSRKLQRLARRLRRAVKQSESPNEEGRRSSTPRSGLVWEWAVQARSARRAATLRSAIEMAGAVYASERLHDVRIGVKRLRYSLELSAEAKQRRAHRDVAVLKHAQDLLGRLHDVEVLIKRVRRTQAAISPPMLSVWREIDMLAAALEDDCRTLHAHYMRERAKLIAIADRIHDTEQFTPLATRSAVS